MSTINRKEILDLLASGKINAVEAAELLNSAEEGTAVPTKEDLKEEVWKAELDDEPVIKIEDPMSFKTGNGSKGRWLHVRVRNLETGKNKVSVNIPLPVVKFGLKIGRQFSPELNELDMDEMYNAIGKAENGMIVDVQDEESNEHVQVFID